MNNQILTEIEINRKIYFFQKAIEQHFENNTAQNSQAVEKAKRELIEFAMKVRL
ncbi:MULTISPECIES: hypothetical protein [unclassified Acinetobacter]|uniref:hypothetical protein n=1 Tax=unclassified Acinetobacter TaxID=196816 RepID=UPI002934F49B|nr:MULTISPECIES: hypothetical protein [unclassified Acinetobacter]WOE32153.1 hypothetical protein QSG84_02765 [Acinetobacter sp. SAAs470]WOE37623.1 hypothetical protein QSG86_11810 [Acinetobacter sp. SAAs474]